MISFGTELENTVTQLQRANRLLVAGKHVAPSLDHFDRTPAPGQGGR